MGNANYIDYDFFMAPCNGPEDADIIKTYNLEDDFPGLKYRMCKGLEVVGKPKNVYTESYAERSAPRVWHPLMRENLEVTRETTTIELTLIFVGDNCREVYNDFVNRVLKAAPYVRYWDTARNKVAFCLVQDIIEPSADIIKGERYIDCPFKLVNLWGETLDIATK